MHFEIISGNCLPVGWKFMLNASMYINMCNISLLHPTFDSYVGLRIHNDISVGFSLIYIFKNRIALL